MPMVTLSLVDSHDGSPVTFAIVTLGGMQGSSNEQGKAILNVSAEGQLKLIIRHSNYFPINTQVQVPPNAHTIQMRRAKF